MVGKVDMDSKRYILLVFVEISANPGHCDDEGEDGEADYEGDLVAHDAKQVDVCKRKGGVGEKKPGISDIRPFWSTHMSWRLLRQNVGQVRQGLSQG